jgi:hypothetical protein
MRQLIEALKEMKEKYVDIYTEHMLFGKQHIQMKFDPETEIGFGFRTQNQVIYIDKDDVISYEVDNRIVTINGSMMKIKIVN